MFQNNRDYSFSTRGERHLRRRGRTGRQMPSTRITGLQVYLIGILFLNHRTDCTPREMQIKRKTISGKRRLLSSSSRAHRLTLLEATQYDRELKYFARVVHSSRFQMHRTSPSSLWPDRRCVCPNVGPRPVLSCSHLDQEVL